MAAPRRTEVLGPRVSLMIPPNSTKTAPSTRVAVCRPAVNTWLAPSFSCTYTGRNGTNGPTIAPLMNMMIRKTRKLRLARVTPNRSPNAPRSLIDRRIPMDFKSPSTRRREGGSHSAVRLVQKLGDVDHPNLRPTVREPQPQMHVTAGIRRDHRGRARGQ